MQGFINRAFLFSIASGAFLLVLWQSATLYGRFTHRELNTVEASLIFGADPIPSCYGSYQTAYVCSTACGTTYDLKPDGVPGNTGWKRVPTFYCNNNPNCTAIVVHAELCGIGYFRYP